MNSSWEIIFPFWGDTRYVLITTVQNSKGECSSRLSTGNIQKLQGDSAHCVLSICSTSFFQGWGKIRGKDLGHALGTLNAGRIGCIGCKGWMLLTSMEVDSPFLQTTCFRFCFDSDAPIVWEAKSFDMKLYAPHKKSNITWQGLSSHS